MSRYCKITKRIRLIGNKRSHSMNSTKRNFMLNLQKYKFWIIKEKKFFKILLSNKALRIINKFGINSILNNLKK